MSLSDRADRGGNAITPASKDVIVEMEGVGKSYRTGEVVAQVLGDVNLRIARDELVVMFGVSGCGKTTLLNLLGALDTPSAGTIVVDGEAISSMTERARSIPSY